jgi:hypothetical protein
VVLRKDPTAAAHVADCTRSLQTWFAEARRAPDPTPDLLRIWNGIAALLGDSGAFVETGIAWSHQAPDDPKARFAVFEALLQLDAAEPAAAMLQALEADATIVERGLIDASLLRRGRPELESYRANGRKPVEASGAKNGGK